MKSIFFYFTPLFSRLAMIGMCIVAILFILLAPQKVLAETGINRQVNFQGKLVNPDGTNVANGNYSIVFSLYNLSSGGSALWSETQTVTATDGIFRVSLGSQTAIPSNFNFNWDGLYLGVKVGADSEMSPRIRMTAVPYAFNAEKVSGLTVQDESGNASTSGTLRVANGQTITFGNAFSSGSNALTFTTSASTDLSFGSSGSLVLVDTTSSQALTNKTVGSTGLIFDGATTDITTATDQDFILIPNGTGRTILSTDSNSGVYVGTSSNKPAVLSVSGGIGSNSLLMLDQLNNGDIIAASSSGTTRFVIGNTGILTFANGESIDNTSVDNTIILSSDAVNGAGVLRLPVKTSSGDPTLDVAGNMYYNQSSGKFRCYQNTGWVDCIPSSNLQSTSNTNTNTLNSATETSIISASITPSTTSSQVWIVSTVEVRGDGNTNRNVTLTLKRGASCAAGSTVGVSMVVETDYSSDNYTGALNFVDVPGSTSSQTYHVCAISDAGSPTTNSQNISLYEPNGGAVTAGSLTVRETDGSPTVSSVANLEFGPSSTSTDEFIVSDQTGGVARVQIGNQVAMLNQSETVTGIWNFTGTTLGINATSALSTLDIRGNSGTTAVASVSGATTHAALVVDNNNSGDIFTASSSGLTRFVVKQNGSVGIGTSQPLASLDVIGDVYLSSGLSTYRTAVSDGTIEAIRFCTGDGETNCISDFNSITNFWDRSSGALFPKIAGIHDLLLGGTSTDSAKFAFINVAGGTPTASLSGNLAIAVPTGNSPAASLDIFNNGTYTIRQSPGGNAGLISRLFLAQNGSFGIGTTSPLSTLDIRGVNGTVSAASASANSSVSAFVIDNSGRGDIVTASSSGLTRFVVRNNGDVGIGTTIPGQKVDVVGGSIRTDADIYSGDFYLGYDDASATITTVDVDENLTLDPNGNGTITLTTPTAIFSGTTTITASSLTTFTTSSALAMGSTTSLTLGGSATLYGGTAASSTLTLAGTSNGTPANAHILLNATGQGNVGIGTSAPLATLDVRGQSGTVTTASVSANSILPGIVVDNRGLGDILAASASGLSRFVVKNNGVVGIGLSNPSAAKFVISDSSLAPGIDLQQIAATTGVATTGIDGLQIDYATSGSTGGNDNAGLRINVTSNNSGASTTLEGIYIGNLSSAEANATEYGLRVGTGWDTGILVESGGITISGGNLTYTNGARPTKTITLAPEYPGAILTASGSATITGDLTSDASASAALSNYQTYYEWTSSETSLQDYTVVVRVALPADFSAWATSNAITISYNTELGANGSNKLDTIVYNSDVSLTAAQAATPVAMRQAQFSSSKTWTTLSIDDSELDAGNTRDLDQAGEEAVLYLRMYSRDNNHVQIGTIKLNYLAAF